MENRIKLLYSLTIVAIVGLIAVQCVWLYKQYRYSLEDQENVVFSRMAQALASYREVRIGKDSHRDTPVLSRSGTNINHEHDQALKTKKASITLLFEDRDIRRLLGLSPDADVTAEAKVKAHNLFNSRPLDSISSTSVKRFEVPDVPIKTDLWNVVDDVVLEHGCPFTKEGIDSIIASKGLNFHTQLTETDTMMWAPQRMHEGGMRGLSLKVIFPYSTLEHKAVVFTCRITAADVVKSMGAVLIMSCVLSLFLITCLVWQIRTIRQLVRADKVRNSFVHTMIHELKRPISTLKLCISSLENPNMKNCHAEITSDCRTAVNNLSNYFSRLRDITFNESGQIPLNLSACNLREMVDSVIDRTIIPSDKNVEIINGCDAATEVVADRLHLSQMISNLIENAVKYSGDSVEITVACRSDAGGMYITISDTGNGIAESDIKRIFDKFYRSASAMQSGAPGVGLGLTYVRLLAESHGGTVKVTSREGKGSTFTIILPQK